jgi:L-alanine-DL-glutamate epimerase-like enolase superfamily enzyme
VRLRERLATPLLVGEHVRGIEAKAAFLIGGGGDIIHADPEYDMGITGAIKIAHLCQSLGLDVQYHASAILIQGVVDILAF